MVANKPFVNRLESNVEPIKQKLKAAEAAKEKQDSAEESDKKSAI